MHRLVGNDQVKEAIDMSLRWIKKHLGQSDSLREILVISAGYRRISKQFNSDLLSVLEYNSSVNRLLHQLLILCEEATDDYIECLDNSASI